MTTWRKLIADALSENQETWESVVHSTLNEADLDRSFNDSYGSSQGMPFTLWTQNRVYFPVVYDGMEWAASAPRNPCDEATGHVGGE